MHKRVLIRALYDRHFFFIADRCCTKLQKKLFVIIYDPFAVLFVILCILLNTVTLALDHHGMSRDLEIVLRMANYVSVNKFINYHLLTMIASTNKSY